MLITIAAVVFGLFILYRLGAETSSSADDPANAQANRDEPDERAVMANVARGAETVREGAERMCRAAERYHTKTEFKLAYCRWFYEAEAEVKAILRIARSRACLDTELDADPKLRKIYDSIELETFDESTFVVPEQSLRSPDWAKGGPPAPPLATGDPELDELQMEAYEERRAAFEGFLKDARTELSRDHRLLRRFVETSENRNLRNMLERLDLPR